MADTLVLPTVDRYFEIATTLSTERGFHKGPHIMMHAQAERATAERQFLKINTKLLHSKCPHEKEMCLSQLVRLISEWGFHGAQLSFGRSADLERLLDMDELYCETKEKLDTARDEIKGLQAQVANLASDLAKRGADAPQDVGDADLAGDSLHNLRHTLSDDDLFTSGRTAERATAAATRGGAVSGVTFGRCCLEARRRFKARPRRKGHTLSAYLTAGFGVSIATINRWMKAAELVDDPDVLWSDVVAWCGTGFSTPLSGAERIVAMRKAFDKR